MTQDSLLGDVCSSCCCCSVAVLQFGSRFQCCSVAVLQCCSSVHVFHFSFFTQKECVDKLFLVPNLSSLDLSSCFIFLLTVLSESVPCSSVPLFLCSSAPLLLCSSAPLLLYSSTALLIVARVVYIVPCLRAVRRWAVGLSVACRY